MALRMHALPVLAVCLSLGGCVFTSATPGEGTEGKRGAAGKSAAVDPDKYHAPDGFFGYAWGTPFTDIPNLRLVSGGVALAAGYQGKVMDIQMQNCGPTMPAAGPCRIHQLVQGAGSYVMASYFRDFEPYNPYADAELAAAIYYFCARTNGDYVSTHVRDRLHLCGGDVIFQSDTPAVWKEGDPVSNYERVVSALTARYGRPDNFHFSGYVAVEDKFGRHTTPRTRSYDPLYWCKITQRAIDPSCEATITLDFDSDTNVGRILFATDSVYRFAEAMHAQSEQKIPLYERLHGHEPDRFKSKRRVCTGTHLCGGSGRTLTEQELAVFQPDPGVGPPQALD